VKDSGLGQGFVWEQFMKNEEAQKGMIRAGLMLMAENQRTQFVWNTFMKDPAAQNGMTLAGFQPG